MDLGRIRPDLRQRGVVADSVAELREAELEVEHEVRVAEPERHFSELEMVEIGGAGEVVRAVAIAGLRGSDSLVDEAAGFGDTCPDLGELVARRGREGRARERAGGDQSEQDGEACASALQDSTALSRLALIASTLVSISSALFPSLISFRRVVEIASSSSSIRSWSRSPSGASTDSKWSRYASPTVFSAVSKSPARAWATAVASSVLIFPISATASAGVARPPRLRRSLRNPRSRRAQGWQEHGKHAKHGRQSKHGNLSGGDRGT